MRQWNGVNCPTGKALRDLNARKCVKCCNAKTDAACKPIIEVYRPHFQTGVGQLCNTCLSIGQAVQEQLDFFGHDGLDVFVHNHAFLEIVLEAGQ